MLIFIIGIIQTIKVQKHTKPRPYSLLQPYTSGMIAGIGAMIMGFVIIVRVITLLFI